MARDGDDEGAALAHAAILERARVLAGGAPATLGDALQAASQLRAAVDRRLRALVVQARDEGATWAEIGAALGVTAQAAQQRYRSLDVEGRT